MQKKMAEIQGLAHKIDSRINVFEGYCPKEIEHYKGEVLFWRQIVNLYGLFADCDRFQIKEKENLIEIMFRYGLIDRSDMDFCKKFWNAISDLRKWFCHNNDKSLHFIQKRETAIKNYLNAAFIFSTNKPTSIENLSERDWDLLTSDIERKYDNYLEILRKGFMEWEKSRDKNELVEKWISIYATSLSNDSELIFCILYDIAEYEKRNNSLQISPQVLAIQYKNQLKDGAFSEEDFKRVLEQKKGMMCTKKDIVLEGIRSSGLI